VTRRLIIVLNDVPFFLSHRLPIATGARRVGYDVHVVAPEHPRRREIEEAGLEFHALPLSRRGMAPVQEITTFAALIALYRRLRPDLAHHVTHKPVLYGSIAARVVGVPAVVNAISGLGYIFVAEGQPARLRQRVLLSGYRLAFGHPRCRGIFQNPDDLAVFRNAGAVRPEQVTLIHGGSGVDLEQYRPSPEPEGRPVVVLPARMLWDKGVGEFVGAARLLRERGVASRMVLVGDPDPGNPRSVTEAQLRDWVMEGAVEWWPYRTDMATVFAASHIVCLPSYREGTPRVLLEAAASARPSVTTDVPGCREVVRHGETGLLVPLRNVPVLADALETLLGDPALRGRYGLRAREVAQAHFGVGKIVETTLGIYDDLLSTLPHNASPRQER